MELQINIPGIVTMNSQAEPGSFHFIQESVMPLKKGKSQATVSGNIKTLVDDWKTTGSIGTSHPQSKEKAVQQAVAIAMGKARENRKKT